MKTEIQSRIVGNLIIKEKYMFVDKYIIFHVVKDALNYLTEDIKLMEDERNINQNQGVTRIKE